jgi:hypothetical protein
VGQCVVPEVDGPFGLAPIARTDGLVYDFLS